MDEPQKLLATAEVSMDYWEWLSVLAVLDKQRDELIPGGKHHRSLELIVKKIERQLY